MAFLTVTFLSPPPFNLNYFDLFIDSTVYEFIDMLEQCLEFQ